MVDYQEGLLDIGWLSKLAFNHGCQQVNMLVIEQVLIIQTDHQMIG